MYCARCSDPTLDFLYNSARSECCPESYCLLTPDAKELTCNKCGSIAAITVNEVIDANEDLRICGQHDYMDARLMLDRAYYLQSLIDKFEKFSKILSPLNLNLINLNDTLLSMPLHSISHKVSYKYAEHILPAYRRYLTIGDFGLPGRLMSVAVSMSFEDPATTEVLKLIEEAFAAALLVFGPGHVLCLACEPLISRYRNRLSGDAQA